METGICSFFCWENRINSTGTGMLSLGLGCYHWKWDLKNETGNGIPIFGSAQLASTK